MKTTSFLGLAGAGTNTESMGKALTEFQETEPSLLCLRDMYLANLSTWGCNRLTFHAPTVSC